MSTYCQVPWRKLVCWVLARGLGEAIMVVEKLEVKL